MTQIDPSRWPDYNAAQRTRAVRPLAKTAAELAGVDSLVAELEVVELLEEEVEGMACSGPKHWHTYRLLAQKPQ